MNYRTWREFWALVAVAVIAFCLCCGFFWYTDQYRGRVPVNCKPVVEYQVCDWVKK